MSKSSPEMTECKVKPFWGSFKVLGSVKVWQHNPALRMSVDNQYAENKKNNPNFKPVEFLLLRGVLL